MSIGELPRELGRYDLFDQIAAGGMATVHFGRMHGAVGFQRVVAIKRLHAHYAHDAHFVDMFLDEARLAARLKHPNVIQTLDVVADENEVFLVMEFVLGESLEALMPRTTSAIIPLDVVSAIVCNVLEGLHGAHEALSDTGEHLGIVHRDVSPPNILVGDDGIARVFDFGIAKAAINTQETRDGVIKGKVTYMAPEQVIGTVDRRADIYAAGVILWELLVGRRRHAGQKNDALFIKLATNAFDPLEPASVLRSGVPEAIDAVIARATDPDPEQRFATAREMAMEIERAIRPAPAREVGAYVRHAAGARIDRLADVMKRIESDLQPRSEPSLSVALNRGSIGSVRVVTSSLTSPGGVASSVPPEATTDTAFPLPGAVPGEHPPRRRRWTMPAAVLAFSAALLLVGLRVLGNHSMADARDRTDANTALAARPPVDSLPSTSAALLTAQGQTPAPSGAATTTAIPDASATAAVTAARPAVVWTPPPRPTHVASTPSPSPSPSPAATQTTSTSATAAVHKAPCDNPFTIGVDGIRQIKPECM